MQKYTYIDYLRYQEKSLGVREEETKYVIENRKKQKHDKIFKEILDNKREGAKIISKKSDYKISESEIEKYNRKFVLPELENRESDVIYKLKDGVTSITDGVTTLSTPVTGVGTFKSSYPLWLFGINSAGDLNDYCRADLYYCKLWQDGKLVRDFIPVIDNLNRVCLWDKVTQAFFYEANNNNFVAGYKDN